MGKVKSIFPNIISFIRVIEPGRPSPGNRVAFIEEDGVPIELIQIGGDGPE